MGRFTVWYVGRIVGKYSVGILVIIDRYSSRKVYMCIISYTSKHNNQGAKF